MDLTAFASEVGPAGPVTCVGARRQWDVGGPVAPGTREVKAPAGIEWIAPEEMTAACGAGTTVAELDAALAERGQLVALPDWGTVGGVLAVGRSDVRRLGYGPVRDALLQAGVVTADGLVGKVGGPTVKNVSGFDLARLLVGSLGTLALMGDVILRTRPRPAAEGWYQAPDGADPFALFRALYRPVSLLWDGTTTWARLEGDAADLRRQAAEPAAAPVVGTARQPARPHGHVRGRDRHRRGAPGRSRDGPKPSAGGGGPPPRAPHPLRPHGSPQPRPRPAHPLTDL